VDGQVSNLNVSATPALESYRAQIRQWLAETEIPEVPLDVDERFEVRRAWQKRLDEAGWISVDWPSEYGGHDLSALHQVAVYEELIRAGAPLPVTVSNLVVVGPTLLAWGTEQQKREFLPKLPGGDVIFCQGFSEPNAGSDLASLTTSAERVGDDFVVRGQKVWTSYAHRADFCAVLARTNPAAPPHKGISYLLIDMKSAGVTIRRLEQITGNSEFSEVFFDDVRVPATNLVGPVDEGWKVAMHSLGNERSRIILQRRAGAQIAFDEIVQTVREHVATTGIQLPPTLVRRFGEVHTMLAALDGQVRTIVARLANDAPRSGLDSLDKLVLTEVEQEVFALAYDLLGPYRLAGGSKPFGLEPERWIHDYFYARSWSISGGTTQVQRNVVAERVLGLPRT
jgi:alkylation response protein AidB-like acyl-CoA dehydrogenase